MQFRVNSGDVTGASAKTILAVLSSTTRRPKVVQIVISCTDLPNDATAVFQIAKITTDGTGSGVTPHAVDSALGAASCTAKANYTGEPTYGPVMDRIGLNQRVTVIWNAPFDGAYQPRISGDAADLGIGIQMVSGPAVKYAASVQWDE